MKCFQVTLFCCSQGSSRQEQVYHQRPIICKQNTKPNRHTVANITTFFLNVLYSHCTYSHLWLLHTVCGACDNVMWKCRCTMLWKNTVYRKTNITPSHSDTNTSDHKLPLPFETTLSQGNFQFPNTCKHAVLPQLLWSSNRPELCPGGHCVERWLGGVCFLFYGNVGN